MTAVIYARYSSDNQREESIEGQIRECTDYAEKNGVHLISVMEPIAEGSQGILVETLLKVWLNTIPQSCPKRSFEAKPKML